MANRNKNIAMKLPILSHHEEDTKSNYPLFIILVQQKSRVNCNVITFYVFKVANEHAIQLMVSDYCRTRIFDQLYIE